MCKKVCPFFCSVNIMASLSGLVGHSVLLGVQLKSCPFRGSEYILKIGHEFWDFMYQYHCIYQKNVWTSGSGSCIHCFGSTRHASTLQVLRTVCPRSLYLYCKENLHHVSFFAHLMQKNKKIIILFKLDLNVFRHVSLKKT